MLIGERYKVESDDLNVTVYKKEIAEKSGKERWEPLGYFSTVKHALKFLVDREIKETGLKDFETVDKKLDELFRLVEGLKIG